MHLNLHHFNVLGGPWGPSKQAVLFDLKPSRVQGCLHYVWHQKFQTGNFIWNLETVEKGKGASFSCMFLNGFAQSEHLFHSSLTKAVLHWCLTRWWNFLNQRAAHNLSRLPKYWIYSTGLSMLHQLNVAQKGNNRLMGIDGKYILIWQIFTLKQQPVLSRDKWKKQ